MLLRSLATSLIVASAMCFPSRLEFASNSTANSTLSGITNVTSTAGTNGTNGTNGTVGLAPNVTITAITTVQPNATTVAPGGYTTISNHTITKNYTITKAPEPTTYTAVVGGTTVYTCPVCLKKSDSVVTETATVNRTVTYTAVVGGTTRTSTVSGKTVTTCEGGTTIHTCPVCEAATSAKSSRVTYTAVVGGSTVHTCPVCMKESGSTVTETATANKTVTYTAVVGGTTRTSTVSGQTVTTCEGGTTIHTCPVCEAASSTKSAPVTYTAVLGGTTKTKTVSGQTITTCAGGVTIETCPVCEAAGGTVKPTSVPSGPNLTFSAIVGGTTKTRTVGGQTVTTCEGGTTVETCFHCRPASTSANATSAVTTPVPTSSNTSSASSCNCTAKPTCSPASYFKPQVLIINAFGREETQWVQKLNLTQNITVPLLSPLYPHVHSNQNFTIMSVTTGEAESNAAATITALLSSSLFDFSETYFFVSGIAGGSPIYTSIGSVTFPHYAVQIGSAYELDSREVPENWTYSYVNYGDETPNKYPTEWYGTEVFELNGRLVDRAFSLARNVTLTNLTSGLGAYVHRYNSSYAAVEGPKAVSCDTATSDVYWKGFRLAKWAEDTVSTFTNGTAKYCSTQQEDNASLEAILRAAKFGLADFNRVVISRGISDFDRPFDGANVTEYSFNGNLTYANQSESVALDNLYKAGLPFVQDVVNNWDSLYRINHFSPHNYTGDYFETLGGKKNF